METDPRLAWGNFLDSYALISGQMNSLLKTMKHEKTPHLRRYLTLPLLLSPDRDEELVKLSEHRVHTFSHDLVPNYLRTRPDPELETRHAALETRAAGVSGEQQGKQLAVLEKVVRDTLKLIQREREEMDAKSAGRAEQEKTHSVEDTRSLLDAINHGKGLKTGGLGVGMGGPARQSPVGGVPGVGPPQQQGMPGGPQHGQPPGSKAPSTIKTNIKAANQVHPYQR